MKNQRERIPQLQLLDSVVVKEEYYVQEEESPNVPGRPPEDPTSLIKFDIAEIDNVPNIKLENQRIRCLICDTTFWTYDSFRAHMKLHIEESTRYQCVFCCQCIFSLDSLVAHLQEHTEGLTTNTVNQQHINSQLPALHPAPVQPMEAQETEENFFNCAYCTKRFTKRCYMSLHIKHDHKGSQDQDTPKIEGEIKEKCKKRPSMPDKWKRNIRKKSKNSGHSYINKDGKLVPSKVMKPPCESCRYHCPKKIPEDVRQKLFDQFWSLGNLHEQRHYIYNLMETIDYPDRQRKLVNRLKIIHNGVMHRVCQRFFLNTFGITGQFIHTINTKAQDGVIEADKRGTAPKEYSKKRFAILKPQIVDFINRIPRYQESCKFGEVHEYIEGKGSLTYLYDTLKSEQQAKGNQHVSYELFRNTLYNDFNISLNKSRNLRCDVCERREKSGEQGSQALQTHTIFVEGSPFQFPSLWDTELIVEDADDVS